MKQSSGSASLPFALMAISPRGTELWRLKDVDTALNCAMRILLAALFPGRPRGHHGLPNSFGRQRPFSYLT